MSIYKIWSEKGPLVYYGSSVDVPNRWSTHKSDYNTGRHKYSSSIVFDTYGIDNCEIEVIEQTEHLLEQERWWIENHECVNKYSPYRTKDDKVSYQKEYYQFHKEESKLNSFEYSQSHKEKLVEYNKKYRLDHTQPIICECGGSYVSRHKSVHLKTKKHLQFISIV